MRTTILSLLLAALAFPGTAAAEKLDVEGPLAVKGHGPLRGELKMANPSESKPVVFGGQVGFVRFIDLAGDLRVQCKGRGDAAARENDEGHKVYVCKGRGGRARAHGSHFRVALFALKYGILIPEGVTGTLNGKFRTCTPGEDGCGQGQAQDEEAQGDDARAARLKERQERLKERAEKLKERAEKAKEKRQGDKPKEQPPAAPPSDEEIEDAIEEVSGDE